MIMIVYIQTNLTVIDLLILISYKLDDIGMFKNWKFLKSLYLPIIFILNFYNFYSYSFSFETRFKNMTVATWT